jgi:hypothetical protein
MPRLELNIDYSWCIFIDAVDGSAGIDRNRNNRLTNRDVLYRDNIWPWHVSSPLTFHVQLIIMRME